MPIDVICTEEELAFLIEQSSEFPGGGAVVRTTFSNTGSAPVRFDMDNPGQYFLAQKLAERRGFDPSVSGTGEKP